MESAFNVPILIWLNKLSMTQICSSFKTIHNSAIKHEAYHVYLHTHSEFQPDYVSPVEVIDNSEKQVISGTQTYVVQSFTGRNVEREVENFICSEDLGLEIT